MKKITSLLFISVFVFQLSAQKINPLITIDSEKQQIWVDSILNSMTLDEKIGQLFMVQAYSNKDEKHEKFITEMIEKYHVGNLIFMQGTPEKQAALTNKYQAISKAPLMVGFDGEWGLDMRLKNTYRFPWNMTLGAIRNDSLVKNFGKHLGKHCKRLGIHINFAPVVDININPKNPIIGNRSFGENKQNVTQKAISFTEGMQSEGVLANAKHFPGHGDTAADSHIKLPVLNFDKKRLNAIELYPYKKIFDTGIGSVMTAHLSIPSLEPNKSLPTSLSKKVVTDLLQKELGFSGLIITDGMNMKGAANYASPAAINLAAITAGNDLLLIPHDIPETIALIKKAIQTKKITEKRIEFSAHKVLMAKYWTGLHEFQPIELENLNADLNTISDELLHRKLVENSITVLKNKKNSIPILNLEKKKIAYVQLGDDTSKAFVKMLKNYAKVSVISDTKLKPLLKKLKPFNLVIIGFHKSNKNPWKSYRFTKKELLWLKEISRKNNVILDVFASPYSLLQIAFFKKIEGLVVSYQNSKIAQELSAQALFGGISTKGKLPVSVNKHFSEGDGLTTYKLSRLAYSMPEDVNLSSKKLALIDVAVDSIINEEMAPGVQVLIARYGKVVYQKSFGYHTDKKKRKVKNSDVYDLASLTKILASLPLIMKAEEENRIPLSANIKDILPSFKNTNKDTVTVKEILSHYGRLKAWIPFYKNTQDSITNKNLSAFYSTKKTRKFKIKVAENLYIHKNYIDSVYQYIKNADQREYLEYKYSDLGYYIFKSALERSYNEPLDELINNKFYHSLGANRTGYIPLNSISKDEIVPSENDTYFRNQVLQGNVHDMGAAMLGGVAGHAGLFSNANDVAKIMQMYLQKGYFGGKRYLKPSTIKKFNTRYYKDENVRRGLGFDKPQLDPEILATCGCVSDKSFGHSGFTGTYTWADPQSGLLYVFISNRTYPTMDNRSLMDRDMRTNIQQLIQDAILEE